ncbi:MAG TPA: hypothetical protein VKZ53_00660 [Candidatus Angelobacter sp.]|nr:hypothetical protein [Candidatus Angelobacter sp.]
MPIEYAYEKFRSTIHSIVTSSTTDTPQDRLYSAAMGTTFLDEDDFPSDSWKQFQEFKASMTQVPDSERGSFRATADSLTDVQAHELLVMFHEIAMALEDEVQRIRIGDAVVRQAAGNL